MIMADSCFAWRNHYNIAKIKNFLDIKKRKSVYVFNKKANNFKRFFTN